MSSSSLTDKTAGSAGNNHAPIKKRRKGATRLSCAECRRFVLASTQELHEKISELSTRVRQLEDGLRSAHSHLSSEIHPLLTDELLRIKMPLQREPAPFRNGPTAVVKEEEQNPDIVDAFGTLSISISGRTKYFGTTANSWNEHQEDGEEGDQLANLRTVLPLDILKRASALSIATSTQSAESERVGLQDLFWYLPSADKALELREIYFRHAAWMYNPISQEAFDSQIYSQFYDNVEPQTNDPQLAHRLSLLFVVLAIGCLVNTDLQAYNLEAEKYHQLARAALFSNSIFDEPTVHAVQALFLMTFYMFLADRHGTSSGARWAIMGIAVKVGQNRDSGRWKVDSTETQHRRELFWELFTYDSWQCLTFGRPPSFALPHVDTKLPFLNDTSDDKSFHAWKHRFTSECMNLFHDQAFGAKMPTYATVLQLDRKMRAFPVPPVLQVAGFGSSEPRPGGFPDTVMLTLQRHIVLAIREMNLLYLHRSFFARAISDHPKDPLGSPYGTSVIAAYRSAGSLVALMRNLHAQLKELSERIWFLWTHMFSCAIVLGSIVTRCPSMSLAPSALVQLDSACELFAKAARGFRAQKVLEIMLNLQDKAHYSLNEFRKGRNSPPNKYGLPSPTEGASPTDDDDELSVLGGKTRLVAKKEPSSPLPLDRSPTTQKPVVPIHLSPSTRAHPNILEYLDSFNPQEAQSGLRRHDSMGSSSGGPSQHLNNSYPDDLSPVSVYGMSTMPTSPAFQADPESYHSHHQQQPYPQSSPTQQYSPHHAQHQNMSGMGNMHGGQTLQYFPVFDYGTAQMRGVNGIDDYGDTPMLDAHPVPHGQRRGSGSPEGNMHTTWSDFAMAAAGFSM
ncbi:hypothetical protein H0H92_010020 [Tricholoma furcatifolium]|nr:hypothetical protein H0H92_010020 [Tricholoma furcatifolium]